MHLLYKSCGQIAFLFFAIEIIQPRCNVVASSKGVDYLIRYGYLLKDSGTNQLVSPRSALISFQTQFGLNPTGNFDQSTNALMSRRRCGMSDHPSSEFLFKRSGFQLYGTKWKKNKLTYNVLSYTNQLSRKEVRIL
jgi:hypothetical protein